jgi:Replication protein
LLSSFKVASFVFPNEFLVGLVVLAAEWGISLRELIELQVNVFGNIDAFGHSTLEDEADEEWRGQVAQVLVDNGLPSKANRFMECCCYAHLYECEGPEKHNLFSPIYCDLRFCPRCAPRQFARLIEKYAPILEAVYAHKKQGFRLREITLTTRNTGSLTAAQPKPFNLDVKKALKTLMVGVKGWGAIWCDEVGFNNTNLHAHILLYGPYVAQSHLAKVWNQVSGHEIVYISEARGSGAKALIHMLKYVSKPPADNPNQIGLLEVAFHGTRRVHALGLFYNYVGEDTDHLHSEWETCPHCGADLMKLPGAVRIERAIMDGHTFVGTRSTARRKTWVN